MLGLEPDFVVAYRLIVTGISLNPLLDWYKMKAIRKQTPLTTYTADIVSKGHVARELSHVVETAIDDSTPQSMACSVLPSIIPAGNSSSSQSVVNHPSTSHSLDVGSM